MGDFERTFGAGADADAIVEGFARGRREDEDIHQASSKTPSRRRGAADDTLFADLGLGFRLIRKSSRSEFFSESGLMSDDDRLHEGAREDDEYEDVEGVTFLVLRDVHDSPSALIYVVYEEVWDIRGLSLQHGGPAASATLFAFFRERNWRIGTRFSAYGWITDVAGKWHAVDDLPAGLTISDGIDLSGAKLSRLPERLTIGGYLRLSNTQIEQFPHRLTVGDDLNIEKTPLQKWPLGLTVGQHVFIGSFRVVLPDRATLGEKVEPHELYWPPPPSVTIGGSLYMDIDVLPLLPVGAIVIVQNERDLRRLIDKLPAGAKCTVYGRPSLFSREDLTGEIARQREQFDIGWSES